MGKLDFEWWGFKVFKWPWYKNGKEKVGGTEWEHFSQKSRRLSTINWAWLHMDGWLLHMPNFASALKFV